ncbi:single-stranded-DNA-specific exonuclease RecJ, partial [Lactobacillus sp. XV13L]|nr:single-stranded-DNA-specific exonuclease RecJ [Lactobacillus sp. XV13L]
FQIAPRLNAIGRLDKAINGVKLLLTEDVQLAKASAKRVEALNQQRKKLTAEIVAATDSTVQKQLTKGQKIIVVAGENWHQGVLGIVAGKIAEKTNHPTIVLTILADGKAVGSARSIADFNLYQALAAVKQYYQNFGGHAQACGLTM